MPTKKTTKRSTIKSTKSSTKKRLIATKFKFNKVGVLAVAGVLAVVGAVFAFKSYAASPCSPSNGVWQCFSDSAGITHDLGYAHTVNIYTPSLGFVTRTVWNDGGGSVGYAWRGPGTVLSATNIKVCWYYIAYTYTATGAPAHAIFDVVKNNGLRPQDVLWSSGVKNVSSQGRTIHNGSYYYTLDQKCQSAVHVGGTVGGFGMRVQDVSNSDSYVNVYKTTWQILY